MRVVKKLNSNEIRMYLMNSATVKERQARISLLEKCMQEAAVVCDGDVYQENSLRLLRSRELENYQVIQRLMVCLSVLPEKEQDVLVTFFMQKLNYAEAVQELEKKWKRQETMLLVWRKRALDELREIYNSDRTIQEISGTAVSWNARKSCVQIVPLCCNEYYSVKENVDSSPSL